MDESLDAASWQRQWRGRGRRATGAAGLFPRLLWPCGLIRAVGIPVRRAPDQLFSSDLIFLSNSSNEVSPLIISPLMKKVGVELTFSTSLANFWSAAILSSSAWSFEAVLDLLLAEAGLLADPGQRLRGVLHHPVVLLA